VVIQNAMLAEAPWVAEELFRAFAAAKSAYLARLAQGRDLTRADAAARERQAVVGDPFPFGVAANRKAIETLVQYAFDQHVIPRRYAVEELFAPNTLALG
jgi:4,5-dihydroxyphthalate decarboxylase